MSRRQISRGIIRGDRGSSAIELSIVAPVIILMIFSTVQFALWLYGRNVALQSAREGVSMLRLAAAADGPSAADVTERETESYAAAVGRESLRRPKATAHYLPETGRVDVTVAGDVVTLVPMWTLRVTRTATGEIERFEEDG